MSAAALPDESSHAMPAGTYRFGMIVFLVSEAMLFAGLIGAYIVLRWSQGLAWPPSGAPDIGLVWPPSPLNLVMIGNTIVLLGSSGLFLLAERAFRRKSPAASWWLLATILAGSLFLGVQAWEWAHLHHEGLWFDKFGIYGSCFFVVTGFHGFHVFVGLLLMLWCLIRHFTGSITPVAVENTGLYWHFVDVVWICLYTLLYVL